LLANAEARRLMKNDFFFNQTTDSNRSRPPLSENNFFISKFQVKRDKIIFDTFFSFKPKSKVIVWNQINQQLAKSFSNFYLGQ